MALADRLQRVLDLRGLTPYDLSKRAGLSQSQVRIWIDRKSERVSTEALRKVAAAALAQLVPYRVAAWVATTRARILARAFNAIAL